MDLNSRPGDALIFIPDISGYTHFVKSTEIQHAKHIVEELLEAILSANQIGLELSEIEGDALLLYRKGRVPTCQEMLDQVRQMYISFHAQLKKYETQRICSCGACSTAHNLKLKFVAHYGEMTETVINNRPGLFGEAVIVAHRLLKNNIDSDEYCLFTDELLSACATWSDLPDLGWSEMIYAQEEYDFGLAKYGFAALENLSGEVPDPRLEDFSIPGATKKIFESVGVIDAPIDITFNVVSDYDFRSKFVVGQLDTEILDHKIFQNGTVHKCVLDGRGRDPILVTHDITYDHNQVTFVESDQKNGVSAVWTLNAIAEDKTQIVITNFIKPNFIKVGLFQLFLKPKLTKGLAESWQILNTYCKMLYVEHRHHPNSIVLPEEVTQLV